MATADSTREVSYATPSDREVSVTRAFDAPRRLVFEAHTKCEHLQQWMLGPDGWAMPICEIDLRAGGGYRWGWRRSDGSQMEIRGTYKEVAAPERLVTTESWGADWPETTNTMVLAEKDGMDGMTTMTITILYPSKETRDAALQTGMKEGMNQSFERLEAYLRKVA